MLDGAQDLHTCTKAVSRRKPDRGCPGGTSAALTPAQGLPCALVGPTGLGSCTAASRAMAVRMSSAAPPWGASAASSSTCPPCMLAPCELHGRRRCRQCCRKTSRLRPREGLSCNKPLTHGGELDSPLSGLCQQRPCTAPAERGRPQAAAAQRRNRLLRCRLTQAAARSRAEARNSTGALPPLSAPAQQSPLA